MGKSGTLMVRVSEERATCLSATGSSGSFSKLVNPHGCLAFDVEILPIPLLRHLGSSHHAASDQSTKDLASARLTTILVCDCSGS